MEVNDNFNELAAIKQEIDLEYKGIIDSLRSKSKDQAKNSLSERGLVPFIFKLYNHIAVSIYINM